MTAYYWQLASPNKLDLTGAALHVLITIKITPCKSEFLLLEAAFLAGIVLSKWIKICAAPLAYREAPNKHAEATYTSAGWVKTLTKTARSNVETLGQNKSFTLLCGTSNGPDTATLQPRLSSSLSVNRVYAFVNVRTTTRSESERYVPFRLSPLVLSLAHHVATDVYNISSFYALFLPVERHPSYDTKAKEVGRRHVCWRKRTHASANTDRRRPDHPGICRSRLSTRVRHRPNELSCTRLITAKVILNNLF